MKRTRAAVTVLISLALAMSLAPADDDPTSPNEKILPSAFRARAEKLRKDGNHKEAYALYSALAISRAADPGKAAWDMWRAVECLYSLGRISELDAFREKVIAARAGNWHVLFKAAQSYLDHEHNGYMVAGTFHRGHHRGGGKRANAYERDRVRALQLMQQAMPLTKKDANRDGVASYYYHFASMLMGRRSYSGAWRLQYATDLTTLPDYDEGYYSSWRYHRGATGAPVDENGKPVFHHLPKSWQAAKTDGQRWRWCLMQAIEHNAGMQTSVRMQLADFLHHQFGVQTMGGYGRRFGRLGDTGKKDTSGTYELHTLKRNETIAKLATGVQRFTLPGEFNFIAIYESLAGGHEPARRKLAEIYENRRQYPDAARQWKLNIAKWGPGRREWKKKRLNQIVGNWGLFDSVATAPAGTGATVEFRFRNAKGVAFTARAIEVDTLLEDVKAYLKKRPKRVEYREVSISNLGYRLVTKDQKRYLGKQVASWSLDLKPRDNHWDKRVTVTTPLQKAGAYLVTAKVAGGNTCSIVLWVADTVIVKKNTVGKPFYYVADAVTGKPVARANVEFFGYWQEYIRPKDRTQRGHYVVHTKQFAEFSDADGQVTPDTDDQRQRYRWIVTARTKPGRMAYLGWTSVWAGRAMYDRQYKATKTFVMTDRPVYRPKQKVRFKFWVNHARYDVEGKSAYAGKSFTVEVRNPKNEKLFAKQFTADEFGGFDGELTLAADATLGTYRVYLPHAPHGGGHFRVEEYKKPEYEVTVEAPEDPVALGETFEAKIKAKYYFGAPVTHAKVVYKVLRTSHSDRWFEPFAWDWLFDNGYWWYAYDYTWYPGWHKWGCRRPVPWWWWGQWARREQPEVVAEGKAKIAADGTFNVKIDTAVAKAVYGDTDHKYEITAEVTDRSRRTIVGKGSVLVAREPFKVYAWVHRGHYRVGDTVHASFRARRLDEKAVEGKGVLKLLKIGYKDGKPVETEVQSWKLNTDADGKAARKIKASAAGQYRLSYTVTDAVGHKIEGGYVFVIRGEGFDGSEFRFNDVEIVTDKAEYKPGEKVKLMVNTNRAGATVLLFVRPTGGVYLMPKVLRLTGKSAVHEIAVTKKDMPNFFVEAVTVHGAKVHTEARQIVVPPEKRILNVQVTPAAGKVKPGQKTKLTVKLTDVTGEPYNGSAVVTMYDKAVEYISGGSNVPEIKAFFWKWKRHHHPRTEHTLSRGGSNLTWPGQLAMQFVGAFGSSLADDARELEREGKGVAVRGAPGGRAVLAKTAELAPAADEAGGRGAIRYKNGGGARPAAPPAKQPSEPKLVEAAVRTKFADTALWVGQVTTGANGTAEIDVTMPENLSTWMTRVWAMGHGTRVGQGTAEVITTKDLIVRLQAPRFFVQKDEVVISANVHNYLKTAKKVKVVLALGGKTLTLIDEFVKGGRAYAEGRETVELLQVKQQPGKTVTVPAGGETRVDWRVKVVQPGKAVVTVKALTDEESDAMRMSFPVYVHGMLKTDSYSGAIRPDKTAGEFAIRVPGQRRAEQSRLEVRYSPTLAGAMVDALPYLVSYPYGCTEQTLNRFLPTVITQKVLIDMGLDLEAIRTKRTNLNAQEIGDDKQRAKQWKRFDRNAVFDKAEVDRMVKVGVQRLVNMQLTDGGWGWFSGWGERSWPHTTAVVVHGLQIARANDVAIPPNVLARGVAWLKAYQARELQELINGRKGKKVGPWKSHADSLDALVHMVLVDARSDNKQMRTFLYEDRKHLPVYAKAMLALACHTVGDKAKRDMLIRNIEQFLVTDDENQTAWLKLPNGGYWWCWYGSEYEAHAYYLKLLAAVKPKDRTASRLVKYLLNNRKHATYWKSTRDTALCVEAFADYIRAAGEDKPDMTVQVLVDGKVRKTVKVDAKNLFTFDNKLVIEGKAVTTGKHTVRLVKKGKGPLYYNGYLTVFTLEDHIAKAGLEIKVNRHYYKLVKVDKTVKAEGARGQAVDKKVEKHKRVALKNLDQLVSGDLVEIELVIDSKNDYEYIVFEDMKAAGFEPVQLRSGYSRNGLGAYMELRDERVTFFVRRLARGRHSIAYRMRAEIPGKFSALPTKASAMYAPELKANSDEIKLKIKDAD